jgi:eukaryotic-like serine/threonine-protein kinase
MSQRLPQHRVATPARPLVEDSSRQAGGRSVSPPDTRPLVEDSSRQAGGRNVSPPDTRPLVEDSSRQAGGRSVSPPDTRPLVEDSSRQAGGDLSPEPVQNPRAPAGAEAPSLPFLRARSLKRELLAELMASWDSGTPVEPDELLARWPADAQSDPDVANVLFEDYLRRAGRGETPSLRDYQQRFPAQRDSLASLLDRQDLLRSLGASQRSVPRLRLPDVGDDLFGFRLCGELGQGAFARVFLAEQGDLAGRPVVLKVSAIEGDEPQTLAQLQHTNIVPIYSVHEDAGAGLRAVCMPYFGGASLGQVLRQLWQDIDQPTTGAELVQALALVGSRSGPTGESSAPACGLAFDTREADGPLALLRQMSYPEATAWIIARLAEGLHHAHQRGVLHRDIKPSNVLLGTDGTPMLLDFNLAQKSQDPAGATLGGTVAYMAPEHLRALARQEPALARLVEARADIYSLGMVLFEMLTGRRPFEQSASYAPLPVLIEAMAVERSLQSPSLKAVRPDVSWGLESIVRKCLAPDPACRYSTAEELAEDLRRLLEDRPLKHAPELSRRERLQKWARRHPRLSSTGAAACVAALLLGLCGLALAGVRGRLTRVEDTLADTQSHERFRAHEEQTLQALLLCNTTSDQGPEQLAEGLRACERALGLYGVLEGGTLERHPDWARLNPSERLRLAEDTQELLLLLAGARVRQSPGDRQVLHQALSLLDRAETLPGLAPARAIWEDRALYREALGETQRACAARGVACSLAPSTARDFYLLGFALGRTRRYAEAIARLDEAVRLNPRHFWSWLQRGVCRQEQKQYDLAAADFSVCVGLRPDSPWGYFHRGTALAFGKHFVEAIQNYTEALRCDPAFRRAWLNRGLARQSLGQDREALADLDQAASLGLDDAMLHSGRGISLERLGRPAEADRAFETAAQRLTPLSPEARRELLWTQGFAVALRCPDRAWKAFEQVLREEPNQVRALYGCALILTYQNKLNQALPYYNRALALAPDFPEPRRYRALLFARLGKAEEAVSDINHCLKREESGANLYVAACVTALLSDQAKRGLQHSLRSQSLSFLKRAFQKGYDRNRATTDEDLAAVRNLPGFRELLGPPGPEGDKVTR